LILLLCVGITGSGQSENTLVDAVKRGDREVVRELLRGKPDVNAAQADGTTALHWAVRANDVELVAMLLRAGAKATVTNRYGIAPITLAATNGSVEALDALLKAGANANTQSAEGEPIIMTAARTGNAAALKLLIGRGADVNAREKWFGETAVMWAAAENHADAIRVLAESGADINARSTVIDAPVLEFPRSGGPNSPFPRGGWTALMFAAREGATDAARTLAELGADLNVAALPQTDIPLKPEEFKTAEQGIGTTALVFAIINSHYDLAAVLLEKGAKPNVEDISGKGAL
jgi:ankyrin repeat protein